MGAEQVDGEHGRLRRVASVVGGFLALGAGILLLVLPGPGLLLVLGGLVLLSNEFAWARRLTDPVRTRAVDATRASVESGWRIAGTVAAALALVAAGVVWSIVDGLPFSGWPTGVGLGLSGLILLAVLGYAVRNYREPAVG